MGWILGDYEGTKIQYHPQDDPEDDPIPRVGDPWSFLYNPKDYSRRFNYSTSPWTWLQDPRNKRQRIQEKFISEFLAQPDKSLLTSSTEKQRLVAQQTTDLTLKAIQTVLSKDTTPLSISDKTPSQRPSKTQGTRETIITSPTDPVITPQMDDITRSNKCGPPGLTTEVTTTQDEIMTELDRRE